LIANDWRAIVAAVGTHGAVRRAAIESCCGAADLAEELVQRAGWSVDLAHPGFVKRMKQNPDKTDYADARMLADLTRVGYLPRVWLAPAAIRDLRQLTRHRQQLVNQRRAIKTRILAILREARVREPVQCTRWFGPWLKWLTSCIEVGAHARWVIDQHLAHLAFLKQQIEAIMRRLRQVTATDPIVNRLLELPGVGEVTACTLRAEIGRFDRFVSGKQLSRFCGLSPRNASSGERQADAGLIRAANSALRSMIIETAHRLGRLDPRWRAMRDHLRARGKPGSVIAAAIGNRWTRWLYQEIRAMAA
jgi:transposase